MDKSFVTITCIKNPFAPKTSQEIRTFPVGRTVREYIGEFYPDGAPGGYDVAVAVNGQALREENRLDLVIASGGLHLAFCSVPRGGHGKNIGALIAMIAVVVVSVYAPYLAPESWGLATYNAAGVATGLTMTGTLASAGVLIAGGLIVSSVFPATVEMPTTGNLESSSTYGWDLPPNSVQEGVVVPILYGTARIAPPIIGRYILTEDDTQSLNILFLIAGHEIDDFPLDEIRINQTNLYNADGSKNYLGVPPPEVRLGAVNQAVIPYFQETRQDTSVGAKIDDDVTWTTRTTSGSVVEGIGVTLTLPGGLFYANNDGGLSSQTIKIDIEYKKQGDVTWTKLRGFNSTPVQIPSGYWTAGYWKQSWVSEQLDEEWIELERGSATPGDHLEGDPYPSNIWIDWGDQTGPRVVTFWRWVATTEDAEAGTVGTDWVEITGAQSKPIRRSFYTDGLPAGTYDVRVKLNTALPTGTRYQNDLYWESLTESVPDDFNYPGTALLAVRALATDQLSGGIPRIDGIATRSSVPVWTGSSYEDKPANNPAWSCYDILHNSEYGGNVPYSRIDFQAFSDWADYCTTKGYTTNIYIDAPQSIRRTLDMVGLLGRGSVFQLGSTFTVVVDKAEDMGVQKFLFTMGNISADSFNIEYLPMDDRANAVEVTYWDETLDYERTVLEVYSADFDAGTRPINKKQLTLYGCTDRDQAISQAVFYLNCNRYITVTVSFDADVDAIACLPGQIIEVSHDVPLWGFSGRLVSATSNTAVLDRQVTLYPGITYQLTIRHQDDDARETVYIQGVGTETTTDTLTLASGTWTKTPVQFTNYAFGEENLVTKKFRVLRINRSGDMRRKIVAVEHYDGVYTDSGTVVPPTPWTYLAQVKDLVATEVWKGGAGTNVVLSWRGMGSKFWIWYKRVSGGPWIAAGTTEKNQFEIINLDYGMSYDFAVSPNSSYASGEVVTLALQGKDLPPTDATFDDTRSSFPVDRCYIYWNPIEDVDADSYEVRTDLNWGNPTNRVYFGKSTECIFLASSASHTFYLKSVDAYGNYSVNYDTLVLTNGIPSTFTITPVWKDRNITITWTPIGDLDLKKWEVKFYADASYTDLRRTVEVSGNQFVYTAEQINTDFGPVTPPLTVYIRVIAYDYWDQTRTVDSQVSDVSPNAPTFVGIVGSFKMIIVEFTTPTDPNWDVVQVYRSATNDSSTAVLIGEVRGNTYWDSGLDSGATWYYWLKAKSAWGELSSFDVGQYSGHSATTIKVDTIDIEDEAIDVGQLASTLTIPKIVASLPSLPDPDYPDGSLVVNLADSPPKLYRNDNGSWTAAVDVDDLDRLIVGADIAGKTILAKNLYLTDTTNLIFDPLFSLDGSTDVWEGDGSVVAKGTAGVPSGAPTDYVIKLNPTKYLAEAISAGMFHDCTPGDAFHFGAEAASDASADNNCGCYLQWYDKDGVYLSQSAWVVPVSGPSQPWTGASTIATAPANARRFIWVCYANSTSGTYYFAQPRIRKAGQANMIVDGAIKAVHMDVDSVSAAAIQAGAVGADEIAANAVAAKHLVIGDYSNVVLNPIWSGGDISHWGITSGASVVAKGTAGVPANAPTDYVAKVGPNYEYMYNPDGGYYYDCTPGEEYFISAEAASDASVNGNLLVGVQVRDKDGTLIDNLIAEWATTGPSTPWTKFGGIITIPAGGRRLYFLCQNYGTAGYWYFTQPRIRKAAAGELIVDGSIATRHLQADSILAKHVLIQGQGKVLNSDPGPSGPARNLTASDDSWIKTGPGTGYGKIIELTDGAGKVGNFCIRSDTAASHGPGAWYTDRKEFPVDPNKTYRVQAWTRGASADQSNMYLAVILYDKDRNVISGDGTWWYYPYIGPPGTSYTLRQGEFGYGTAKTIPANAKTMSVGLIFNYGAAPTSWGQEAQDIRIEEKVDGSLVVDGSITADHLSVSTLSAVAANMGTLTAGLIQSSNYLLPSGSAEGAGMKLNATAGTVEAYGTGSVFTGRWVSRDASYQVTIGCYHNPTYGTTHFPPVNDTYYPVDGKIHVYRWTGSSWSEVFNAGYDSGYTSVAKIAAPSGWTGLYVTSSDAGAILGSSQSAQGIQGNTATNYGTVGYASGAGVGLMGWMGATGKGQLMLLPTSQTAPPSHSASAGTFYMNSYNELYVNINGSSGYSAWKGVGPIYRDLTGYGLANGTFLCWYSGGPNMRIRINDYWYSVAFG